MNEITVTVRHNSRIAAIRSRLDEWRTEVAKRYAEETAKAAEPPVLTGALKSSVYVATKDGDNRAEAMVRARQRRPKARFGKQRRVTKPGEAIVAWSVEYAQYVERRKPWVRRALREALRRARPDGFVRVRGL